MITLPGTRTGPDPERLILTLGCQRSGTTLLHLVLGQHPAVRSLDEPASYAFLRSGSARRGPLINVKLPRMGSDPSAAHLRQLLEQGARGVYIYRDPRAVAASMMRLWVPEGRWAAVFPREEVGSLSWECDRPVPEDYGSWSMWRMCLHHIDLKHRFYTHHLADTGVATICYEQLVADPARWVPQVAGALGLSFHPAMLQHHRAGRGQVMGGTRRNRPIDTASVDRWRAELTVPQVEAVNHLCAAPLAFWQQGFEAVPLAATASAAA